MNATELKTFAILVQKAAQEVPAGKRLGSKAFINHVWAIGGFACSLVEFKAALIDAHRACDLTLGRCDMVEACDTFDVRRSKLEFEGFEFHMVRIG